MATRSGQLFAVFVALVSAALAMSAAATYVLVNAHDAARMEAVQGLGNLALSLDRNIVREIDRYEHALFNVGTAVRGDSRDLRFPDAEDALQGHSGLAAISVIDAAGKPLRSFGSGRDVVGDVSGSSIFQRRREDASEKIFIDLAGRDVLSPVDALIFSQRLANPDKSFGGMLVGSIPTRYFDDAFSAFNLGEGGAVALLTNDGRLVSGFPRNSDRAGRDFSASETFRHLATQGPGAFEATSLADNRRRIYVARNVPGLPLQLFIGASLEAAYADFRLLLWTVVLCLGMVFSLHAVAGLIWRREFRRRRSAEYRMRRALVVARRSGRKLERYFDALPVGVFAMRIGDDDSVTFEQVNQTARLLLMLPADAAGRTPRDVWGAAWATDIEGEFRRSYRMGTPIQRDFATDPTSAARKVRVSIGPVGRSGIHTGALVCTVIDIAGEEDLSEAVLNHQPMTRIGTLTGGVAHDFNNLFQSLIGHLELLGEELGHNATAEAHVRAAAIAAGRGARLTHSLLSFSSRLVLRPEPSSVESISAAVRLGFEAAAQPGVTLAVKVDDGLPRALVDRVQLEAALLNLVCNGQEAMHTNGGVVTLHAKLKEDAARDGGEPVAFVVSDTGEGMAADVIQRARDPFYTTRGIGEHSGLGLSMADGFARQSGGGLSIRSWPGLGTRVELWVPSTLVMSAASSPSSGRRGLNVLLVEDSPDLLTLFGEVLTDAGYNVFAAANAAHAAQYLRGPTRFDLLVTDYVMPGMNGIELTRLAQGLQPEMATLLITGYADEAQLAELPSRVQILRKPFRVDQLLRRVREAAPSATRARL